MLPTLTEMLAIILVTHTHTHTHTHNVMRTNGEILLD